MSTSTILLNMTRNEFKFHPYRALTSICLRTQKVAREDETSFFRHLSTRVKRDIKINTYYISSS